jgi:hypothetical protein
MDALLARLRILGTEIVLGTLIAILSIFTAASGYQGSLANGDQGKANVQGQKLLTGANAEYLSANQMIVYDYTMYDGWYTADTAEKEEYYQFSYSEDLQAAIAANESDPFSEAYYEAMYSEAQGMFEEADRYFALADEYNSRGDQLQLVMMIMAVALAFAAWASLLKEDSKMRIVFAIFSIIMFAFGLMTYLTVPTVTG